MKFRTAASCISIVLALAMPFTVLSMTRALFDNGTARATLNDRENEVRRLADLDGDVRSLASTQASAILSRHSLSGADDLSRRLAAARGDLEIARAAFASSTASLRRALVVGFLCVAATSWSGSESRNRLAADTTLPGDDRLTRWTTSPSTGKALRRKPPSTDSASA